MSHKYPKLQTLVIHLCTAQSHSMQAFSLQTVSQPLNCFKAGRPFEACGCYTPAVPNWLATFGPIWNGSKSGRQSRPSTADKHFHSTSKAIGSKEVPFQSGPRLWIGLSQLKSGSGCEAVCDIYSCAITAVRMESNLYWLLQWSSLEKNST